MKKVLLCAIVVFCSAIAFAQSKKNDEKTLLWKVSGKGMKAPSYLFGTMHMICGDDIKLSDSLLSAISVSDKVYLELDLDNVVELMSAVSKMKMNGDTTLKDLLTPAEYDQVKKFFNEHNSLLPFAMLETYKPMLTASTLMQATMNCKNAVAIDQLVMKEAKAKGKSINGLESMAFQISIFDSIPYGLQAKQLVDFVQNYGKNDDNKELDKLTKAYRDQELNILEELTRQSGNGIESFTELLLYKRNEDWVIKLDKLFRQNSLVVAVGAGHLPGKRGVIELLRKAGYTVEPVKNEMIKTFIKSI